jgi:hypothetical protein
MTNVKKDKNKAIGRASKFDFVYKFNHIQNENNETRMRK